MNRQPLGARHQRVQRLRRLLRRPSARVAERAFVAEGLKVVEAALDMRAPMESLYLAADGERVPGVAEMVSRALSAGVRVFDLAPGIMERVADTVTPQAVCAVIGEIGQPLGELMASQSVAPRLFVVCIDVRDPGNLGALIRSAAGAGATGVLCCEGTVDPFNPKTVRATAGAIFAIPLSTALSPRQALEELHRGGVRLVATTAHEGSDYAKTDLSGDIALVLGNEASGLPPDVVAQVDERVTIPTSDSTESLNVAMTATILCYEIARRRRLS
ncbi:MAG: TrmH family RNA methyltransferase [Acidimicrobiales bacterium]